MNYLKKILIVILLAVLICIINIFIFTIVAEYLSDASDISVFIGLGAGISLAVMDYYIIEVLIKRLGINKNE